MARGVQIGAVRLKRTNMVRLAGLLIIAALAGGCSGSGKSLEEAYTFSSERGMQIAAEEDYGRAEAFASDLCVVTKDPYADEGITSEAAAVFDLRNSRVISSKNALERLNPASTTKIMTLLLAVKYGDLSDPVTVTQDAVITETGATLCHINPGDVLTLEDLLYGLMLPSGNDAGAAIAVHMGGSIEGFSRMMNEEARRIGATDSHFINPHGLTDPDHYTTAYDLYLIFNEGLKDEMFRKVTGETAYTANYHDAAGEAVSQTWKGGNRYMTGERQMPDGLTVFGGKTGTTSAAGYCLIMASRDDDDQEYISVVLKADNRSGLYDNMTNIVQKIDK